MIELVNLFSLESKPLKGIQNFGNYIKNKMVRFGVYTGIGAILLTQACDDQMKPVDDVKPVDCYRRVYYASGNSYFIKDDVFDLLFEMSDGTVTNMRSLALGADTNNDGIVTRKELEACK